MRPLVGLEGDRVGTDVAMWVVKQRVGHSRGVRGRYVDAPSLPMREAVGLIPPRVTDSVMRETEVAA